MRSMLPESRRHGQGQWPRRTARMSWEDALAWACRLAADAIDLRGVVSDSRRARIHWCARGSFPPAHILVSVGAQVACRRAAATTASFPSACSALR
eukprot:scaffold41999_cov44-Phaeocystis_antarctica.AAC.1